MHASLVYALTHFLKCPYVDDVLSLPHLDNLDNIKQNLRSAKLLAFLYEEMKFHNVQFQH